MTKLVVSSAEFQKAFGRYREAALRDAVVITNHGRESLVLVSADEYRRLKDLDRRAVYAWELDAETLSAIEGAEAPSEASAFDHELES